VSGSTPPSPANALHVLVEGAAALARGADLQDGLEHLLGVALEATGASFGAVLVQDPDLPDAEVAAALGVDDASPAAIVELAGGPAAVAAATSLKAGRFDAPRVGGDGEARLVTLLPLVVSHEGIDRQVGMLVSGRAGEPASEDERAILSAAADIAAAIVERAQLRSFASERADWLERIASSDPLTGLANRHALERVLANEVTRAGRNGAEVSVAVFDVDEFQEANEGAGREAGDVILREVASAISGTVRMVDTVARLGGDEFVVIAPGSAGLIVARRVLGTVGAIGQIAERDVSVSAGVARFPAHGVTVEELLDAAGGALERAKASGRGGLVEAEAAPA
jgi:diguanylate cyclase (GGDEF)-like protein